MVRVAKTVPVRVGPRRSPRPLRVVPRQTEAQVKASAPPKSALVAQGVSLSESRPVGQRVRVAPTVPPVADVVPHPVSRPSLRVRGRALR